MHPRDRFLSVVAPTGLIAVIATMLVVGKTVEPARYAKGYAPEQPIAFSHRVHAGDNRVTCMNCHRFVAMADSDVFRKAVVARLQTDAPMKWKRVYDLPDHVFFDHRAHVRSDVQCETCHGDVKSMDVLTRVMDLRMGACLECHRDPAPYLPPSSPIKKGPTDCTACHR